MVTLHNAAADIRHHISGKVKHNSLVAVSDELATIQKQFMESTR